MIRVNRNKINLCDYYKIVSQKFFNIKVNSEKCTPNKCPNKQCKRDGGKNICKVIRKEFSDDNGKSIFEDIKTQVTLEEAFFKFIEIGQDDFDKIFKDIKLKHLLIGDLNRLQKIINFLSAYDLNKNDSIKLLFDYSSYQKNQLAPYFEKYLNPRVCYYCNIDYINVYKKKEITKDGKEKIVFNNNFTLDHFIDKGSYPYLALSIFNLIPSCSVCNTKVKGKVSFYDNKELKNTNPYLKSFQFDEKVKFKLYLTDSCKDLNIKEKDNIDIKLKERYSNEYKKYIEVFKLNERYQAHKNIVFEMIQNAELYPESRLKELQDLTGIPYQQIKQDIFNLIDDDVDLSKKPFSKLIKDITAELGLI